MKCNLKSLLDISNCRLSQRFFDRLGDCCPDIQSLSIQMRNVIELSFLLKFRNLRGIRSNQNVESSLIRKLFTELPVLEAFMFKYKDESNSIFVSKSEFKFCNGYTNCIFNRLDKLLQFMETGENDDQMIVNLRLRNLHF